MGQHCNKLQIMVVCMQCINKDSDNEIGEEHELDSNIKLNTDAKSIRSSSRIETIYFYAETFIKTECIILVDASTASTVATMVDDGLYSISGDDLMNDSIYSCKVDIDVSEERIYEYYAVIREDGIDAVLSNSIELEVYDGFTEKELFDGEDDANTYPGAAPKRAAYPIINGNLNSNLIKDTVRNGEFENSYSLAYWNCAGDVKLLYNLGGLLYEG